jgi:hypothetical protein
MAGKIEWPAWFGQIYILSPAARAAGYHYAQGLFTLHETRLSIEGLVDSEFEKDAMPTAWQFVHDRLWDYTMDCAAEWTWRRRRIQHRCGWMLRDGATDEEVAEEAADIAGTIIEWPLVCSILHQMTQRKSVQKIRRRG